MSEGRLIFKQPARLGQDAALALEDYARASTSCEASIVTDDAQNVSGLQFAPGSSRVEAAVAEDIERFFNSLASDAADRLGWS